MEDIEVIYIGRRLTSKGKIGHAFVRQAQIDSRRAIDDQRRVHVPSQLTEDIENEMSIFTLKRALNSVGGVYLVNGELSNSRLVSILGTPRFARADTKNSDLQSAWWAADDAAEQTQKRKSAEKKADADPALTNAIAIVANRYQRIAPAYRRGFKLWLLEQIEKKGR